VSGGIQGIGAAGAGGIQEPGIARTQDWRSRELGLDPKGPSFADALKNAIGDVSAMQDKASDAIAAFARGEPVELHEVMAAAEEAGIALEMLIEIRNKVTDAYRTVINMQT
jgi:flagellar hook-basal body complex protein FliE